MQNRKSQRVPCRLPMTWLRSGVHIPGFASEINEHGLFLITEHTVEVGQLLQVVVQLPSGPLKTCVTARYVGASRSGRGIGAELFVMADADRDRWAAHYKQLQKTTVATAFDAYDFEEITEQYQRG